MIYAEIPFSQNTVKIAQLDSQAVDCMMVKRATAEACGAIFFNQLMVLFQGNSTLPPNQLEFFRFCLDSEVRVSKPGVSVCGEGTCASLHVHIYSVLVELTPSQISVIFFFTLQINVWTRSVAAIVQMEILYGAYSMLYSMCTII